MSVREIMLGGSYLSDSIKELPTHCLLNKGITGCGGTTVELRSKRDSIILCPTKNLVSSKSSLGYFGVDGDITINAIKDYLIREDSYKKILATYDALPKLMKAIPDYQNYFLLIDEYHLLFNDYSFRSKPIRFILDNFRKFNNWCFMTATPLKEEFILEELKDVDRINYIWNGAIPVKISINNTYYVQKALLDFINKNSDKNLHIFLNSVSTISSLVKNLDKSLYRVVCSENSKSKIRNFAKITSPVKKINFYTSCAFEGCDIYDPDGMCVIVCDTHICTTILDISTKIRQICGRLRDSKYKDQCYLILNTSKHRYAGTTKAEFDNYVKESEKLGSKRSELITTFDEDLYTSELRVYNRENYATIYINRKDDILFYDKNLKNIDIYNYTLISEIYKDSISILGEFNYNNFIPKEKPDLSKVYPWILSNLAKSEYTYRELEELFTPILEEHGFCWNKNSTIKNLFPPFIKKKRIVNGKKETHYIFDNC